MRLLVQRLRTVILIFHSLIHQQEIANAYLDGVFFPCADGLAHVMYFSSH